MTGAEIAGERGRGEEDHPPRDVVFDEAVEVEGEPVSRYEACRMGLLGDADAAAPRPVPGCAPGAVEPAATPPCAAAGMEEKIRAAVELLDRNRAEEALALAQEAVREHPSLAMPRVVMARAFLGLGDYAKAQAILMALPAAEQTAETLYYRGLAGAGIGRHENAAKLLESALVLPAADPKTHARASELLTRLRRPQPPGEQPAPWTASRTAAKAAARPKPLPRRNRRGRTGKAFLFAVAALALAACVGGLYFGLKLYAPEHLHSLLRRLSGLWTTLAGMGSSFQ